jgi:hypothetical protein
MHSDDLDEIKRHFNVVAENIQGHVKLALEATSAVRDDLTAFRDEVREQLGEVNRKVDQTHALIRVSSSRLDGRMGTLESRVDRLEES